ncbi:NAD(P)/FAD-dependent oxidoreductase [Acinetobacter pittii]|uniref:NAD(P)/FAD-dependent oxidoreductase n=1 Tax=Acinetobacter pittii TaxID=48296 RepID=UPI00192C2A7E|nr:FAD-dependent oxidoreductase [Acinetobacter pittii]
MKTIKAIPQMVKMSGWNAILPERIPFPALEGQHNFDWVVIGAGYAGLSAARRIAEHNPDQSVALVEAFEIGENASGKNAGFAIDLPHYAGKSEIEKNKAMEEIKLYRYGIQILDTLISKHQIQCDWQKQGRFHAAVAHDVGGEILKDYRKSIESWGEDFEYYEKKALYQLLGTEYYSSAVYTPGTYLLNPAALVRGLAGSLPNNVTVFENSPVIEFDLESDQKYIRTQKGMIRLGKAIITINAFLQKWGFYKNRQIPIVLYASLTAPLSSKEVSKLGELDNWGITPAHNTGGCTVRLTQDRRILMRHGFNLSPNLSESLHTLDVAKNKHNELIKHRFPQIEFNIAHTWMGWLSLSANNAPIFGKINPDVFVASCCNGTGIVRHTVAGTLISDYAMNIPNDYTSIYLADGTSSLVPPRPFLDLGFKLKLLLDRKNILKEE